MSVQEKEILLEEKKMLVTIFFSLSHNVFESVVNITQSLIL